MALRRPAAHVRRAPGWRRSGDESCWESLILEDVLTPVARFPRAPRPQSAIEGGQLDDWLEHMHRMQSSLLTTTVHGQGPVFNNRNTSMPAFDKEATEHAWRQLGIPSFSRRSSSCGSSSQCGSSLSSQESLQTGPFHPPECRGSSERAHIVQAARKEQPKVSSLAQVKTGWLPIQRRVMMVADACNQNPALDQSAGQVKLKQPITPIFQKTQAISKAQDYPDKDLAAWRSQSINPWQQDGEVGKSHTSQSSSGAKTWQTPDQGSPFNKQMPEKQRFPANEEERPASWQVLRRGWNTNRVSALPGGSQSIVLPTGTSSDPDRKSPLMKTTSLEPLKHASLHQTASAEPWRPDTLLQGANSTGTYKSHTPFNRTSSVQPMRATTPLCRTNHSSQPSHIQTSSAVTTLVPQNKAGFSSITISSRKVSRSASLPGSSSSSSEATSSLPAHQPMDPDISQVTVQREATIVKVKEQRVMSGPAVTAKREGTPPSSHGADTVVHRRKATIIKVTEHRESYSLAKKECGTKHPEYRHSYTEGLYKDNSTWSHIAEPLYHHLDYRERPNPAITPNTSTSEPEKNGATLHRSTMSLFLSNSPANRPAPTPLEVSPKAVGQRSDRLHRPLSWYGNVFGHTEARKENVTQAAARNQSFILPRVSGINPVNSDSSFVSPGKAVKEAGQLVANNFELCRDNAENSERRASPSLTLIKAPDPHSHQSPEEVLALNAAAVIANIKLQRQLSKKKTQNVSEKKSNASPQGNTVTDEGKSMKSHPDQGPVQHHSLPPAVFISLSLDPERSPKTISLQEALQRSRPDFISRSQSRVQELERRTQERRELENVTDPQSAAAVKQKKAHSIRSTSLNDNLLKPRDRVVTERDIQLRSKRLHVKVKRKKDEEKKREVCLSNRQRVVLFKKKLLDQILQRSKN